ncbi:proline-rich protein 36-like [Engraulis encrasicolus]|uniref:proline-rich protein 36-like n=1 Tax=Engraulis encrasicolus TaxID=184585 RepID=UPI002FD42668
MGKVRIIEVKEADEENVISFKDIGTQLLSASAPLVWSGMEEKMAQVFMPRSLPTTLGKLPSSRLASAPSSPSSNKSTTPTMADVPPSLSSAASSSPTPIFSPDSSLDDDDVPPSILQPSPSGLPSQSSSPPPPPSLPASTLSLPACLPRLPSILPSTSTTTTPPRLPPSLPPVPVPCKARRTFSRLSLLDTPSSLPPSHLEATPSNLPPLDLSVLLKALGASSTRVAPLPPIQVRPREEREDMESGMESTEESDDEMATVVVWSCDQDVAEERSCDLEVVEEELQEKKNKIKNSSFKSRIINFFRRLNCCHCCCEAD